MYMVHADHKASSHKTFPVVFFSHYFTFQYSLNTCPQTVQIYVLLLGETLMFIPYKAIFNIPFLMFMGRVE
jgi:hypothetical protein